MFETLSDKLGAVFKRLSRKGKLTEKDVDEALREVRLALLEADVKFKVVKDFLARAREHGFRLICPERRGTCLISCPHR